MDDFPSAKLLWKHLETSIKLLNDGESMPIPQAVTVEQLIHKYRQKQLSELAKSTRDTDGSMLKVHFEPRWAPTLIADVHAEDVEDWIKSLKGVDGRPLSSASKARARRLMKQLIDGAMFWRFLPVGENPIKLVKVKGSTLRAKKPVIISADQVNRLIAALPQPYSLMVLVCASLGLRIEETIALQWGDIDFRAKTITIQRAYTHSELKLPKTDASISTLPLESVLFKALEDYQENAGASEWVFPSPVTGRCMSADTILHKKIKPILKKLKLPQIGWHTFRHSLKSWIGEGETKPAAQKDIMRHADIATTMNICGGTPVAIMRPHVAKVAGRLKYP